MTHIHRSVLLHSLRQPYCPTVTHTGLASKDTKHTHTYMIELPSSRCENHH